MVVRIETKDKTPACAKASARSDSISSSFAVFVPGLRADCEFTNGVSDSALTAVRDVDSADDCHLRAQCTALGAIHLGDNAFGDLQAFPPGPVVVKTYCSRWRGIGNVRVVYTQRAVADPAYHAEGTCWGATHLARKLW